MKSRLPCLLVVLVLMAAMTRVTRGHGAYHEQLAQVDEELAVKPGDTALLLRRAALHVEHEDWKAALVDLESAERLGAPAAELALPRGQALLLGGFHAHAEATLAAYLTSHEADVKALTAHARALTNLGRHAEAVQDYRRALRATTEPGEDLILEAAAAFAAHDALDEAVETLRQGLAQQAASPALLAQSLQYELAARHFDAALTRVDALQKSAVRPEPWMARRARILAQAGRAVDARTAWAALRDRLLALPSLERGTALTAQILAEAQAALGTTAPVQVIAPPAPVSPDTPTTPLLSSPPSRP